MPDSIRDRVEAAIGHHYELESELGRGGMSIVYRARDRRLNRAVAIKVLPPELAHDPAVRTRFAREAHTSAQLSHPHIVPIFDVGERDGIVFLVMALVNGENLAARLAREPRPPLAEVRRILGDVAEALGYAHQRGVIHRDIKPDNILIDQESGRVLVTDFGIARAVEAGARLTQTGIAVGTPTYMSPEQATGDRSVDGRSDIYALGVVAYQMLTGRVPFAAPNTMALLLKHVTERPRPIADWRPDAPRSIRETVERAMAKSPDDRWPTAFTMRDALHSDDVPSTSWRSEWEPVRYASPSPEARRERAVRRPEHRSPSPDREGPPAPLLAPAVEGKPPIVIEPAHLTVLTPAQREDLRLWHGRIHLLDRIKAMRWHTVWWLSLVLLSLAGLAVFAEDGDAFPLMFGPVVPAVMFRTLQQRAKSLRASGLRLRRVLFTPFASWVLPAEVRAETVKPVRTWYGRRVATTNVLPEPPRETGPFAAQVRRADGDRGAIVQILDGLPPADRALLPDLKPTVDALVDRVRNLAQMIERTEQGIDPRLRDEIRTRVALVEQEPESQARDRKLAFLQKQRATLDDMLAHRDGLREQLESACLALGTLRLDVTRLRTSGLPATVADVNSATQEARALSHEIGNVLDAMAEARRL